MIKDLTDSLKLAMYERATSPMAGVFVLSWLAFNWKVPLILFWGNKPMEERVEFVSTQLLSDSNLYLFNPVYSAIAVLLLYPILSLAPFYWWHWSSALKKKLKQKIDGGVLLTKEDSMRIKEEIYLTKEEHRKDMESHIEETEYLRKRINSLQETEASSNEKLTYANERSMELERQFGIMNRSHSIKKVVLQSLASTLASVANAKTNA